MSGPRREDLPDGSVRIHFAGPIVDQGQARLFCDFRPPTVGELIDIGDPRAIVYDDVGGSAPYTDRSKLGTWARKLIVGHDYDVISRERDMRLGILLEEVLLDFFRSARRWLNAASAPSPSED